MNNTTTMTVLEAYQKLGELINQGKGGFTFNSFRK